jgi:glutathione S-transferase
MITIWGRYSAFNVQKVLWLVDELSLDYQHINVGGSYGGLEEPEFLTMNPLGKIPVVKDKDLVIWESHTILRYLAATYGDASLYPPRPKDRTEVERWMDWSQTTLQPAFMELFWNYYRTPTNQQNSELISKAAQACEKQFAHLDQLLVKQPYLAGHHFSLADIPAGTTLYRYFNMAYPVTEYPNITKWYRRLQERSAFQKWIMSDFSELKDRMTF